MSSASISYPHITADAQGVLRLGKLLARKIAILFALVFAGTASAGDELTKAIRAVTSAENYRFATSTGAGPAVDGKLQKGMPVFFLADRIEFFRKGEMLVYKQGDAWQRTRTGTLSDPLLILGASAKVRAARLPHEDLATLGKALMKSKKADGAWSVELGPETARALAPIEDRDVARGGVARLWLDDMSRLSKYELAIRVQGTRGNLEIDGTITRTVAISDLGKTKVDVPAQVKKLLE